MTGEAQHTGGQIVARTLSDLGANTIFSVSGNQVLPIFDAVQDHGVRIIHVRHESAAAYAAMGFSEATERPGVVLVSAGPGFLAAATGLATAKSAEVPILFLAGAAATTEAGVGGFQDLDQSAVASVICKASLTVVSPAGIRATLIHAWELARSGVPGPVHVSLPADALRAAGRAASPGPALDAATPVAPEAESTLAAMADRLKQASRPVVIARPSANRGAAGRALWRLTRNLGIEPVIAECPRGLSDLKYREVVAEYADSDCALVVAPADFAVGFLDERAIARSGALLHIDAAGDPPPRRVPTFRLRLAPGSALTALADATDGHEPRVGSWSLLWSRPAVEETNEPGAPGLHPLHVAGEVRNLLRPDDALVLDGGEFCQWIRLGLRDRPNRMLWNSKLGGIGGALPTGLGHAAAGGEGRTFVFAGDGALGYHTSEFETAVRNRIPIVVVVGNDARWGAEWHLQVDRYGEDRAYQTALLPAAYDEVARGLGAAGFTASDPLSLRSALDSALRGGDPACVNVRIRSVRSPAATH